MMYSSTTSSFDAFFLFFAGGCCEVDEDPGEVKSTLGQRLDVPEEFGEFGPNGSDKSISVL